MGRRVYFSRGAKNGALDRLLSLPLEEFRRWYIQQCSDEDNAWIEVDVRLLPLIDRFIEMGAPAFQPESAEHAREIDSVTEYLYSWCNWIENWDRTDLLGEPIASEWKYYRYEDLSDEIRGYFGDEVARLWGYLLKGRAIGRPDRPYLYTPLEESYPNSYWTYDEVGYLYYQFIPYKDVLADLFDYSAALTVGAVVMAVEAAFHEGIGVIIEVA